MNRNEEYEALLHSLDETPEPLETTVQRAVARKNAFRRKRRLFTVPAVSMAACFACFVLLVNLSVPFARACGSVPILRDLAKAVAWSPSLSAAVENDYVQPIGKSQTVNGITATIEYVIVDRKQMNIFFTLDGDYDNLSAEMPHFTPSQHCSVLGADFRQPPGTLLKFTLDYGEDDVPDGFSMTFGATTYVEPDHSAPPEREYSILDENEHEEPDILAEFTFDLSFDPDYTAKGEIVPVDKTFTMDGQTLTVTEAEIYPTHVRLNTQGAPENTAWLKDLDFYLENERGERFTDILIGISATGSADSPETLSFRLNSPYFSNSKRLTLHITGATWLDKDMERIRVDLKNQTADHLPEGVELYSAVRKDGGWIVQFSGLEEEEDRFYQLFSSAYCDAQGNEYDANGYSVTTNPYHEGSISDPAVWEAMDREGEGKFFVVLPLRDYEEDEVWLCPSFSHSTTEETPITIPIK